MTGRVVTVGPLVVPCAGGVRADPLVTSIARFGRRTAMTTEQIAERQERLMIFDDTKIELWKRLLRILLDISIKIHAIVSFISNRVLCCYILSWIMLVTLSFVRLLVK